MRRGGVLIALGRRIFVNNFYLKFIAAVLTLALYIWVSEDRETVVVRSAPVQMTVPDGMVLVSDPVDRLEVTIRGRWSDINRFDAREVDPIRIDLSPADTDSVITFSPNMINVPPTLRVTHLEPQSVYVDLEPESFKTVPIRPRVTGEPAESYTIEDIRVTPQMVTIRGPTGRLEGIDSVATESIDVSHRTRPLQRTARLDIDDGLVDADLDEPIVIEVDIETEEITESFSDLPVEAVNTSYETEVNPDTAEIMVRGPKPVVEGLNRDLVRIEIDLSEEDDRPPGIFSRSAEVFNLPPEVELINVHPERFRVATRPAPQVDTEEINQSPANGGDDL